MDNERIIRIAAVVLRNEAGEVLTVRKHGTEAFMFPGGKVEPGEPTRAAARREIAEELGLDLREEDLTSLGELSAPAANEPGYTVRCAAFAWRGTLDQAPEVRAEIAEARFYSPESRSPEIAPLTRDVVFPLLLDRERGN
ncbi:MULTISPECIES: NUDIX domain-containing protein [unclassified Corynebacterium]|uniref:NUDIX hydrolase n=1 Tax=unclassified Corynebacterium TaxID=2624378 RepID=UPI0029C9EB72|nr:MULTISPECIES: NUDIX domain-containing protein [unclassified Corynebacterium]WPF66939.1 NUDIX domain-containing protein [Corynebacterium sp. 22KM0430]WPF69427.1 NUDIX domain-containing protein [Corynebacterium sp. 21KM1197]